MNPSKNGMTGWKLSYSSSLAHHIETQLKQIQNRRLEELIRQSFRSVIQRLKNNPLEVGGPRFGYHQLGLVNFVYATKEYVLHYAVDEMRHIVYLRRFEILEK